MTYLTAVISLGRILCEVLGFQFGFNSQYDESTTIEQYLFDCVVSVEAVKPQVHFLFSLFEDIIERIGDCLTNGTQLVLQRLKVGLVVAGKTSKSVDLGPETQKLFCHNFISVN